MVIELQLDIQNDEADFVRFCSKIGQSQKLMARRSGAVPRALYDTESVLPRLYSPKGVLERLGLVSGGGLASSIAPKEC